MAALPSRSVMDVLVTGFLSVPDMGCGEFGFMSGLELN